MNRWAQIVIIVCSIGVVALAVLFADRIQPSGMATGDAAYVQVPAYGGYRATTSSRVELPYSDFVARVERNGVRNVTLQGPVIIGDLKNGKAFRTYAPDDPALIGRLTAHGVTVSAAAEDWQQGLLQDVLVEVVPMVLLLAVAIYAMQMPSGTRLRADFGRSRAKLIVEPKPRLTFADVAGADDARDELAEFVEFLEHPAKFLALGARIPKGCLLVGPPGTGKTLLARAIAGEANVPFFAVSGSDFVEMFVGVGASRVRDMFATAKKEAPCIIFVDEIDAIGRRRSASIGGNDEREQTLDQLLVEMDGIDTVQGVVILAATNRPDVLDPALLRPGRFDRQVFVPNPDLAGRERILKVHLRKVTADSDVDPRQLARGTPGFSGAGLANLVNEGALLAVRSGHPRITMDDLDRAKEKILLGPERRSLLITDDDRKRTAYRESGHALVAGHVPGNDPVRMVTILPRGTSLGATLALAEQDRRGFAKQEMDARIAMLLGGYVAEELLYGPDGTTAAAADDIRQATVLARRMVTEFGFSGALGPLCLAEGENGAVLGHSLTCRQSISKATAAAIDNEIRNILKQGEAAARAVLTQHRDDLDRLADALLDRETLCGGELQGFLLPASLDRPGTIIAPSSEANAAAALVGRGMPRA